MSRKKLKSLKDFERNLKADILKEALREEAKNWISEIKIGIKAKEGQFDDFGIDLCMEYAEKGEAIIGFINYFFNLEEEEK